MEKRTAVTVWLLVLLMLAGTCWIGYRGIQRERLRVPLLEAVGSQNTAEVKRLLNAGADPNAHDRLLVHRSAWQALLDSLNSLRHPRHTSPEIGPTALMIACAGERVQPLPYDDCWKTPGLCSGYAGRDDPATVRMLLEHGARVNAQGQIGWTALMTATMTGHSQAVRCLLDHGADIEQRNLNGETVLMKAAKRNDMALVKLFLQRGANVNAQADDGYSPLNEACNADNQSYTSYPHGNALMALTLLQHGANVNLPYRSVDPSQCPSALMTAVDNHNPAVVQVLLAHGAHVNVTNSDDMTALMLIPRIFSWREPAILNMLIAHGARINFASNNGNTALTWAADKDDIRTVRFLLAHGATVNVANRAGHTALWFAVSRGDAAMFNLLRLHGVTIRGGTRSVGCQETSSTGILDSGPFV